MLRFLASLFIEAEYFVNGTLSASNRLHQEILPILGHHKSCLCFVTNDLLVWLLLRGITDGKFPQN